MSSYYSFQRDLFRISFNILYFFKMYQLSDIKIFLFGYSILKNLFNFNVHSCYNNSQKSLFNMIHHIDARSSYIGLKIFLQTNFHLLFKNFRGWIYKKKFFSARLRNNRDICGKFQVSRSISLVCALSHSVRQFLLLYMYIDYEVEYR